MAATIGQFDFKMVDKDFQFAELESSDEDPVFTCLPGSVLIDNSCGRKLCIDITRKCNEFHMDNIHN